LVDCDGVAFRSVEEGAVGAEAAYVGLIGLTS
jgi:hypothetical protein